MSLIFLFGIKDQEKSFEGLYNRCYLKGCRELSVFGLKNDSSIIYNSYMEGKKFKDMIIGSWRHQDSILSFTITEDYKEVLDENYEVKVWSEYIFLVNNQEFSNWPALIIEMDRKIVTDETIIDVKDHVFVSDMEEKRKRNLISRLKYRIILGVISDHNILIKQDL